MVRHELEHELSVRCIRGHLSRDNRVDIGGVCAVGCILHENVGMGETALLELDAVDDIEEPTSVWEHGTESLLEEHELSTENSADDHRIVSVVLAREEL